MMTRAIFVLVVGLALAACGGGSGIRYFIIDPDAAAPLQAGDGSALKVEILDLQVPQYLERPRIATRSGESELEFSQQHQWGDNLRKNLARTLARNLTVLLDTADVSSPFNRSTTQPDLRVLVHIEQFERAADGSVVLVARWQVGAPGAVPGTHQARLTSAAVPSRDYEAMVAVMRSLYGELSRRIAMTVLEAPRG